MARITVEDCLDKVDNRFQLVMISSKRARQLQIEGKDPLVPADKDKPTVIALREIAEGMVDVSILNEKPTIEMGMEEIEAAVAAEGEVAVEEEGKATKEAEQAAAPSEEQAEPEKQEDEQPPEAS